MDPREEVEEPALEERRRGAEPCHCAHVAIGIEDCNRRGCRSFLSTRRSQSAGKSAANAGFAAIFGARETRCLRCDGRRAGPAGAMVIARRAGGPRRAERLVLEDRLARPDRHPEGPQRPPLEDQAELRLLLLRCADAVRAGARRAVLDLPPRFAHGLIPPPQPMLLIGSARRRELAAGLSRELGVPRSRLSAMKLTVLGKSPSWQDAGGACSGYLVEDGGRAADRLRQRRARQAAEHRDYRTSTRS